MKLRTPLPILDLRNKMNLKDPILTMGSCFADSIGNMLEQAKFDVLVNPFGVIYDPLSITRVLTYSINNEMPEEQTYVKSEGVYRNLDFHSSINGSSKNELALKINGQLKSTHDNLKSARWLIISLGTAHVYRFRKTGEYIANCQKLPKDQFSKQLLEINELSQNMHSFMDRLASFNPALNIILTVSPVRHIKDGFEANNLSKSILRLLCNELATKYKSVLYYPAFEIMMDDLRDYRFYKSDMIHPSDQAIDYIWQHFQNSIIDEEGLLFLKEWQAIQSALEHRAFNSSTPQHQQFLNNTIQRLHNLSAYVDLTSEISSLEKQLINH